MNSIDLIKSISLLEMMKVNFYKISNISEEAINNIINSNDKSIYSRYRCPYYIRFSESGEERIYKVSCEKCPFKFEEEDDCALTDDSIERILNITHKNRTDFGHDLIEALLLYKQGVE